jgi:hypothetical protein
MMIDSIAKFIRYSLKSLSTTNKWKIIIIIIEKDELRSSPYKSLPNGIDNTCKG